MALIDLNFESSFLNGNTEICVILPDRPRSVDPCEFYGDERYRVMWLLHGGGGDMTDWVRKSRVELYATEHNLAVVMFSGYNSTYTAWPTFSNGMDVNRYFLDELMPMIYAWFPVSSRQEDNFIAGLSMGGAGALKFMLTDPERFAGAACLSSSARDYTGFREDETPRTPPERQRANAIWAAGGLEKFLAGEGNMRGLLEKRKEEGTLGGLPPLLMACGTADHHYGEFIDFLRFLDGIGVKPTVKTLAGYRHEWRFWDWGVQQAIAFFESLSERKEA